MDTLDQSDQQRKDSPVPLHREVREKSIQDWSVIGLDGELLANGPFVEAQCLLSLAVPTGDNSNGNKAKRFLSCLERL